MIISYGGDDPLEGTAVEVSVKGRSITVRDYGPGVPKQDLARIFDPFYRVENDRNRAIHANETRQPLRSAESRHGSRSRIPQRDSRPGMVDRELVQRRPTP